MAKGDYLTKSQFGTPRDAIEQAAHNWLEANVCVTGEAIMRSLADLIKAHVAAGIRQSTLEK